MMAHNDSLHFGELLKRYRTAAGLTQEELAASAGLSAHGISDLERGARRWPRRDTISLLADALHLAPDEQKLLFASARRISMRQNKPGTPALSEQRTDSTIASLAEVSGDAGEARHLPAQMTSLVGRDDDLHAISQLLQGSARLVTITGPGGIGKTRVGVEVAAMVRAAFPDGVYFVALAAIREPELVLPFIVQILGVTTTANQVPLDALALALQERHTLLLLDNFEQILAAAPLLRSLLVACPQLTILVTSRSALHLAGEQEYLLSPLRVPDLHHLPDLLALGQYPAIALFLHRAQAVKPDITLTQATGPTVAEICARLDGLPLAIELAAARIRILPPRTLLQRLNHRLALLTGGPQDAPFRHQTLQNTIAWSYDLLTPSVQVLFRRLAVFAGGFDLEAAEQIYLTASTAVEDAIALLDGMTTLVESSLLWQAETAQGEPRFGMLETIREYGESWLEASGEADIIRRQHALYYTAMAEQCDELLTKHVQRTILDLLEREHANIRAALRWALEQQEAELGLRLGGAMARFWKRRSYLSEGRQWLTQFLHLAESQRERQETLPALLPIRALIGIGRLAWAQSDYASAKAYCRDSLSLSIPANEKREAAQAYLLLGNVATEQGDFEQEISNYEECLHLFREVGHTSGIAAALTNLAMAERQQSHRAEVLLEESIHLYQEINDELGVVTATSNLANFARIQGDYQRADRLFEQSRKHLEEIGDRTHLAIIIGNQAYTAIELQEFERAEHLLRETIGIACESGNTRILAFAIMGMGMLTCGVDWPERATRLLGASEVARETIGAPISSDDRPLYDCTIMTLQTTLSAEQFATLWAIGRTLTLQQAIAEALNDTSC